MHKRRSASMRKFVSNLRSSRTSVADDGGRTDPARGGMSPEGDKATLGDGKPALGRSLRLRAQQAAVYRRPVEVSRREREWAL